jgi:hypothetical protein
MTLEARQIQKYGWKPSLPDHRDLIADASQITIKDQVDPRATLPPIFDQAAVEYDASLDKQFIGHQSRLDVYYGERLREGTTQTDSGAYGRDGFQFLLHTGSASEADWPYDISKFAVAPPTNLKRRKIKSYKSVPQTQNAIKAVLSNRQTIAFGFSVYESFETREVAQSGIMPEPLQSEKQIGGHEVLMVGYTSDHPSHVLVRNSWGTGWGLAGYFYMPWTIVLSPNMASDFRTIYRPQGK